MAISEREIARWRLHAQRLTRPVDEQPEGVVRHFLAVQGEQYAHTAWALVVRCLPRPAPAMIDSLVGTSLLRTHLLRPTWHLVHADDLVWLMRLTAPRVRRNIEAQLRNEGLDPPTISRCLDVIVDQVDSRGPALRTDLAATLAAAGHAISSHALAIVCALAELELLVCSGPRAGGQHTYDRVPQRAFDQPDVDADEALARLARRYVRGHGPATAEDLAYWATLTRTTARTALRRAGDRLVTFEHDNRTFFVDPETVPDPDVLGRPAPLHVLHLFDEMYRGFQDSRMMIDVAGLAGGGREQMLGIVLADAQLVARCQRTLTSTQVRFDVRPLRPLSASETAGLSKRCEEYARWMDLAAEVHIGAVAGLS